LHLLAIPPSEKSATRVDTDKEANIRRRKRKRMKGSRMLFSRAQNKNTLDCILTEVFEDDKDDGSPGDIRKALAEDGTPGITDLASMDSNEITALSYTKGGKTTVLKRYQVGLIKTFKGYLYHHGTLGKPLLSIKDWDEFDNDAFDNF
jgi:hypothetical protein